MLKRIKVLTSLICTFAIFASMMATPSFADEESATVRDTKDYINAADYDSTTITEEYSYYQDFMNCVKEGYLGYCIYQTFEYNDCLFSEVPEFVELDIMKTTNVKSELCLSLDKQTYDAPNCIAVFNDAIDACVINQRTTVRVAVNSDCVIEKGTQKKLVLKFQNAGFYLYGIRFITPRNVKDYIKAVDYDKTSKSETASDYNNFLSCLENGYLGYCIYQTFEYDCLFSEVPEYVELDIMKTTNVKSELCLSLDKQTYDAPNCIAVFNDAIDACVINQRTTVRVAVNSDCVIEKGTVRNLVLKFQNAGFNLYGIRFITPKDAFEKFSAIDVDVWPEKGNIYNDNNNPTSGFTTDFENSLYAGHLNWCPSTTFVYDCYFEKVPDYVEIECNGQSANGTIGVGLDSNNYALANFSKDALKAQNTKGKIVIPLSATAKSKIQPNTVQRVALRVDSGGVKVYSIKFSSAREVYYDDETSTVCVYGDTDGNAALDKFVAISAEYDAADERFIGAETHEVNKGSMAEWVLPMTTDNTYKIFRWKDLDTIAPIEDAVTLENRESIRVLAIGNSFSQDSVEYLDDIGAKDGMRIEIQHAMKGSSSFQTHVDAINDTGDARKIYEVNGVMQDLDYFLDNGIYDYITVQQVSSKSGDYETYSYADDLLKYIREKQPTAEILLHATWAYEKGYSTLYDGDQVTMHNAILDSVKRYCEHAATLTTDSGKAISLDGRALRYIPTGIAFMNARAADMFDTTYMGGTVDTSVVCTLHRDGFHASRHYGRYLAALTWYACLSGNSVLENTYINETYPLPKSARSIINSSAQAAVDSIELWN